MRRRFSFPIWQVLILSVLFAIGCFIFYRQGPLPVTEKPAPKHISIILSPHYDDAVFSLGGFISTHPDNLVVATFFGGAPGRSVRRRWDVMSGFQNSSEAHKARVAENAKALSGSKVIDYQYFDFQYRSPKVVPGMQDKIQRDIQGLIRKYPGDIVSVYGPALFFGAITHPDHHLLHDAMYAVSRDYIGDSRVSFYIYEDFPYVVVYNKKNTIPLIDALSTEHASSTFVETDIPLTESNITEKIARMKDYTSQVMVFTHFNKTFLQQAENYAKARCESKNLYACEVVYKIQ